MSEVSIYLSGSVRKGKSDGRETFWTNGDQALIRDHLNPTHVNILNPSSRSDDLADFLGTFGRDLFQVVASDVVLVDARDRRGLGVGSEMTIAKLLEIPVVSICPEESHYRRSNFVFLGQPLDTWVHPFIFGLSDVVVNDVSAACAWMLSERPWEGDSKATPERAPYFASAAIRHYLSAQLERDAEMLSIVQASAALRSRRNTWRA